MHWLTISSSSSQTQSNPPMQQPMPYGQSMYGSGAMPYGPAIAGTPYQQPVYGMQPQMMRPAFAPQIMPMGAQMAPYGQGYFDSRGGQPPMIYGGPYEGLGSMPSAYQQVYAPGYQASPVQGYAPGSQLGYQQGYMQASQPLYPQGYPQPAQQSPNNPISPAAFQALPQNALPAISQPSSQSLAAFQALPQNALPAISQPSSQSSAPQTELPATYPHPQQAELLGSLPTTQPNQTAVVQPAPQSTPSPASQPSSQSNYTRSQPSPQQGEALSPVPKTAAPPAYTPGPGPALQLAYPSNPQLVLSPNYSSGTYPTSQNSYLAASQSKYAPPNPSFQQLPLQMQPSSYGPQRSMPPSYLHPIDTMVKYDPVSAKADTHHHALKSLNGSSQAPEVLTAILGSYLASKHAHEGNHTMSTTGTYRHARPEIQSYCYTMDKMESLSVDFISKHKTVPPAWLSAMGPHRRHIFATLYNSNEIVRTFCSDLSGGPLALPELDSYALGKTLSNFNFARASTRAPNINTSLSILSQVRTVILIDDSGSMIEPGHQSWGYNLRRTESRWMQARNLLSSLAPLIAMHNSHGFDLHFLNRVPFYSGLRTSAAVEAAFDSDSPNNGTPTGQAVNDILDAYMCTLRHYRKVLPLNLIVITDGEAQDEHILHWTIEHHVTKIVHRGFPAHQFGVEFVQVGDCQHATRHLIKLEEEVSRHHSRFQRDVVGVTPTTRIGRMDAEKLLGIAISGIDARMNGYMRARGVNV